MDNNTLDLKYTALSILFTRFLRIVGLYALYRNIVSLNRFHDDIMYCDTCSALSGKLFIDTAWNFFRPFRSIQKIFMFSQLFRFYLLENLEEVCKIYQIKSDVASEIILRHLNANYLNSLMREWLDDFKQGKKLKIDYDYEKLLRTN